MSDHAPASLRVGVTGHRPNRLADIDHARLRDNIREVLAAIVGGAPACRATVISPLAEGADRLVAREALAAGYQLICPLPFSRAEYARDFATVASRAEFSALLSRADAVIELPGTRASPELADTAYAAVGRYIVTESHLLIAIWDGQQARGDGGTADVVASALAQRLPVLWIAPHASASQATRVLMSDGTATHETSDLSCLPALIAHRFPDGRNRSG